jgi:hypothetical protein
MSGNDYGVDLQSGKHVISGFTQLSDIMPAGGCSVLVVCRHAPATELICGKWQDKRGDHYFFNAGCAGWE